LDQHPDMMRIRRRTVEHPFGTLKAWMGATHFLTRTLEHVSTESMSCSYFARNSARVAIDEERTRPRSHLLTFLRGLN